MKSNYFLFFAILLVKYSFSQATYFEKKFGTPGNEAGRSISQSSDGSIYVLGYSNSGPNGGFDIALSKLDKSGNLNWTKYFGDSLNNYGLCLNLCADGNLIVCGETETISTESDAFAYKIDTSGSPLWYHTFGDIKNQSFRYIEQTLEGGFIACGFTNDLSNSNDFYILKMDAAGNQEWTANYGGSKNDDAYAIHQTADTGFIVTGDTNSDGAGGYDVEVIKLDAAGDLEWVNLYGDSLQNGCQGILPLSDGNAVVYGETEISPNSAFDFYVEKIDTAGNSLWRKTFGGATADAVFSLIESQNGFVFTGYSNSFSPGPLNLVLAQLDAFGNLNWLRTYGDSGIDLGYRVIASLDSGLLIIGNTFHNGNDDFYLLHTNDSGNIIGMQEQVAKNESIFVYPNPNDGKFTIFNPFTERSNMEIKLLNAYGMCVYSNLFSPNGTSGIQLQLHEIVKPGIYLLQLKSEENKKQTKICIQK